MVGSLVLKYHRRKIHPKKSTQNKKVHLNEFIWTISAGFLTRVTGKQGKFARTFRKSSCERGVFLVFRDFGWVSGPLKYMGPKWLHTHAIQYLRIHCLLTQHICYTGMFGRNYFVWFVCHTAPAVALSRNEHCTQELFHLHTKLTQIFVFLSEQLVQSLRLSFCRFRRASEKTYDLCFFM